MYLYDTEVEILVNGKPVKKFSHEGRTYIQANKGSAYSIKIRNNSSFRRMFCVSVDGINVVDGKAAGASDTGYVLNGYSTYEIQGFRTSNEEVHPFKFSDKKKSYAAKSYETGGDVSNCGVIGVRVYDEKVKLFPLVINNHYHEYVERKPMIPWWNEPRYGSPTWTTPEFAVTCDATRMYGGEDSVMGRSTSSVGNSSPLRSCNFMSFAAPLKSNEVPQDAFDTGTEFSKQSVTDKVSDTSFDIGELLVTIEIFYASREGLNTLGVPVFREVKVAAPTAFPSRFCKPPKD